MTGRAAVLAVDGGNSKADVVLVARDGDVLAARRLPTISHQQVALDAGVGALAAAVRHLAGQAGLVADGAVAEVGAYCLAGADFAEDERRLRRTLEGTGLTTATIVRNDTVAALRAGATRTWGLALICGRGINGVAIGRDGRETRFDAVGDISGDWGGGPAVAMAGLGAAVRAADGRGPATALARLVPAHFGVRSPRALVRRIYRGEVAEGRIDELAPLVFAVARDGDPVARAIVDRLVDELVTMASALARRARLSKAGPEIVLAGGVFRADDPAFFRRLETELGRRLPGARVIHLAAPPVLGAALLGIDALGLSPDEASTTAARVREALAAGLPSPTRP